MTTPFDCPAPFPLAQELVDIILDHLHNDFPALRATSLVCRAWAPSSQLHLHRHLVLEPKTTIAQSEPSDRGNAQKYSFGHRYAFLSDPQHRHLLPYARELRIREGDSPWMPKESSLVPLLTLILATASDHRRATGNFSSVQGPGLQSIYLENLDWRILPFELQRTLRKLLSVHTVYRVMLVDCYLPLSIPCAQFIGSSVRELFLDRIKIYESTKQPTPCPGRSPSPPIGTMQENGQAVSAHRREGDTSAGRAERGLHSLEIRAFGNGTHRLVWWLLKRERNASLVHDVRHLIVNCDSRSVRQLDTVLEACPRLERYTFAPFLFRWDDRDFAPFPALQHNPKLNELRLTNLVADQANWLVKSLCKAPDDDHLKNPPFSPGGSPALALRRLHISMSMPTPVPARPWASLWGAVAKLDAALDAPGSAFVGPVTDGDADTVDQAPDRDERSSNVQGATLSLSVSHLNAPYLDGSLPHTWQSQLPLDLPGKVLRVQIRVGKDIVAQF
ncbi:hypothetical protein HGRIS_000840 [Hohenbuehelia grisea]|uniref:F-box domain-containing protein n=1 Tax=Hohenbuehelia grisea TaxID=104357 RepID=A0ABR3IQ11_9AGAR